MVEVNLPAAVEKTLGDVVHKLKDCLRDDLRSIILYGSAAEGKMRATSDVNVIIVLRAFDAALIDAARETLRSAHATIRLDPMFLLQGEIEAATNAFAVKFADIGRRKRVLFGEDPFSAVESSRGARAFRLRQVLLNSILRMRRAYVMKSLREEQCVIEVADAAGPLRACAVALAELKGETESSSPKECLEKFAQGQGAWSSPILADLSSARETRTLAAGVAPKTLLGLIRIAEAMHAEAMRLPGN